MTSAERAKDKRLQLIYNITLEQQNKRRGEQGNACAICHRSFVKYTAFQDHFHGCCPRKLKKYCGKCCRGLLCFACNKFVVGILERQSIDGTKIDPVWLVGQILEYLTCWEVRLRERGCYAAKEKAKKLRKKQKSVR